MASSKSAIRITQAQLLEKLHQERIIETHDNELFLTKTGQILLNAATQKSTTEINNAYLQGSREWDLRYGSVIDQNHRLWLGIFASWFITLLSLIGVYNIAHQKQVEAIFFAVDKIGRIIATGNPSSKLKISQDMMQQQLSDYIIALRSFSSDAEVNTRAYDRLKTMTGQNMAATVDDYTRKNAENPTIMTITVDISSFNPIPGGNSYQIEWTEHHKMADGTSLPFYYRATLSVTTFIPSDPNIYYLNPLGILITRFDVFKLKPGA